MPVKFVNFLKSRIIFKLNIQLFLKVFKHTFHLSHVCISQKVKGVLMQNLQHTIFRWRQRYWQIFKSTLVYLQMLKSFPLFIFYFHSARYFLKLQPFWIMKRIKREQQQTETFSIIEPVFWCQYSVSLNIMAPDIGPCLAKTGS